MMAKDNLLLIVVAIIIIAIILIFIKPDLLFLITGGESLSRTLSATEVDAGATFSATYTASTVSGKWGATVIDILTCKDSSGNLLTIDLSDPSGWKGAITKQFVMLSEDGASKTITYQLPNKQGITCTLSGNYQFGSKSIKEFSYQTIKTKVIIPTCSSGGDTNKDGVINRDELGDYISGWIAGTKTRSALGEVVQNWANGC